MRVSEEERNPGVTMHSSAKPSRQYTEAAARANRIVGTVKKTIVSRDQGVVLDGINHWSARIWSIV